MNEQKGIGKKSAVYLKYTGLAFQFAAIALIGIYGGGYLDKLLGMEKPYMTVLVTVLLFTGFMYKLYLDLVKNNE